MASCNNGSTGSTRAKMGPSSGVNRGASKRANRRTTRLRHAGPEGSQTLPAGFFPPPGPPRDPAQLSPPPDTFVFELNQKRTRFSDQVLLDQVRDFARTVGGRAFAVKEFLAWPARRCTPRCISKRFGTWRCALAAAGIHGGMAGRYTAQELMERLETAWRAVGRRPGVKALRRHARVTATPFRHRWGTYMNACTLFVRFKKGQITLKDLLRPPARTARKPISPGTRWNVLNRDRHRCRACGRSARQRGVRLEVDHIQPVSAGGSNAMSNLRTLCRDCNRGKSGKVIVKRQTQRMKPSLRRSRAAR